MIIVATYAVKHSDTGPVEPLTCMAWVTVPGGNGPHMYWVLTLISQKQALLYFLLGIKIIILIYLYLMIRYSISRTPVLVKTDRHVCDPRRRKNRYFPFLLTHVLTCTTEALRGLVLQCERGRPGDYLWRLPPHRVDPLRHLESFLHLHSCSRRGRIDLVPSCYLASKFLPLLTFIVLLDSIKSVRDIWIWSLGRHPFLFAFRKLN